MIYVCCELEPFAGSCTGASTGTSTTATYPLLKHKHFEQDERTMAELVDQLAQASTWIMSTFPDTVETAEYQMDPPMTMFPSSSLPIRASSKLA